MSNEKSGNGNTKFDKAVARARGEETVLSADSVEVIDGADFGVMEISPERAEQLIKNDKWEFAPKVGGLEVGKHYLIRIEGNGPEQELREKDPATLDIKTKIVPTWIVSSPDGRFRLRLLGSYDMNQKFPKYVGETVIVMRHAEKRLNNGHMFTEYSVAAAPLPNGKQRDWTTRKAIDAGIAAPALPPPANSNGIAAAQNAEDLT